ncbi:Acyl transferase/acyl hydrolase/lysophospholipase [Akanthomyces lecanii RCEF 1005]|uniref:Acyl transferase/acyl hydrolase/lysophospholipase n=1 Tax=Akanthomyces lecanii RCEF 1005 TaxID=1081108 RepID=A0A167XL68_CORDF|nr:Acyl transferase/acyl hydrolase/lysophospholipase [Akanthomyces lecanii RCEF 1005]
MIKLCDGTDVQACKPHFANSSQRAFQPRRILHSLQMAGLNGLYNFALLLTLLFTDSKYPSSNLDRLLKEEYGEGRAMMDYSEASEMGIAFGFTLTKSGSTDTVIATNYNEVGAHRTSPDYELLEWKDTPTWELVRSAIAAPFYFPPHHIENVGTFQDGGLTFNNPVSIAESEATCLFPRGEPSIAVSIGTGSSDQDEPSGQFRLGRMGTPAKPRQWLSGWQALSAQLYPPILSPSAGRRQEAGQSRIARSLIVLRQFSNRPPRKKFAGTTVLL